MSNPSEQSDHYDTPWEFKNRALVAALGRQQTAAAGGTAKGAEQQKGLRKRLSLPMGPQQKAQQQNKSTKAAPRGPSPTAAPVPPAHHSHVRTQSASASSASPSASPSGQQLLLRLSPPGRSLIRQPVLPPLPSHNYPMVLSPTSPSSNEMMAVCHRRSIQCPALEELGHLVHERLGRAEAEQLLRPMGLGAHLLRRRPDANLALSLRAKEGVLHIKLEFVAGEWVLGDGPRFPRVHSMLRAYRRTELPVRGAEQIRLGVQLRPSDLPGGLLLL